MSFTSAAGRELADLLAWEDAGAHWRLAELRANRATIDLLACTGERVDRLESSDPRLLSYVSIRPTSEDPRHDRR